MTLIDILAGLAITFSDLLAVGSIIGCAVSLIIRCLNFAADPGFRIADKFFTPGLVCLVFGSILQLALLSTPSQPDTIGFVFRVPVQFAGILFVLSILLIMLRIGTTKAMFSPKYEHLD